MPKTNQIKLGQRLKILALSVSGGGKTRLLASFPGPMYIFDFDNRLTTIAKDFPERDDIEYDTYGIDNFKKYVSKLERLQDHCPYSTVVLDSITALTVTSVLYSLGETHGKTIAGLAVPDFGEYNVETTTVTRTLEILKMLPCHLIVTAHPLSRIETTGSGKTMKVQKIRSLVSYGAKVGSLIPNYFDEVYALQDMMDQSGNKSRYLFTQSTEDDILAKTSLPLPEKIDITNRRVYDILKTILKEKGIDIEDKPKGSNQIEFV